MIRSERSIRRELRLVIKELKRRNLTERETGEMFGVMQAIYWALRDNAMAPHKLVRKS